MVLGLLDKHFETVMLQVDAVLSCCVQETCSAVSQCLVSLLLQVYLCSCVGKQIRKLKSNLVISVLYPAETVKKHQGEAVMAILACVGV